ncbi:MAG: helix-turn-helix transcriptional regulator [Clostridia bacterium]|nr:helix-turn-helix transcriptional regulator [Clostridia bacterium]
MNILKESCHKKINIIHVPSAIAEKLYYYVQWTGHVICKSDFHIRRSKLESYLLLYTVSGSGTLLYQNQSYTLKPDTVMLIDCEKPHEYYPNEDRFEFKYIHFNGISANAYFDLICKLHHTCVIPCNPNLEKDFDNVLKLTDESDAEELCSQLIYRLLTELIHENRKKLYEASERMWLREVFTYISTNYDRNLSVSELAETVHMSRCHFSTEFRRMTGFSPYNYILNYRMSASKRMLCTTSKTIECIASECGFSDTSSFIRSFKKHEGISPAAYRKLH